VSDCCLTPSKQYLTTLWREQATFRSEHDVCFALDQHSYLDFYNANFILIGLTQKRPELKFYQPQGEHANNYTTDSNNIST
jgi:hypothetical protein